ncbi:unnamed protein product, partial [Staurois parvus]
MTKRDQHMLKRTVRRSRQLSAESIAKDLQTSCGLQISTTVRRRFMEWVSMVEQLHPSAMQSVGCSGVNHTAIGLYSSTCLTALCQVYS